MERYQIEGKLRTIKECTTEAQSEIWWIYHDKALEHYWDQRDEVVLDDEGADYDK